MNKWSAVIDVNLFISSLTIEGTSKATVNDARYKVSRIVKSVEIVEIKVYCHFYFYYALVFIQCKLLLLKVQCLDNNRWRYVTSATIYELKEKIISNITSFYYKVQ